MHGELVQQRLLVRVQELVAPLHEPQEGGADRVGWRPITEQREAALDERAELGEPEHLGARGGELDREREPVHPTRDLGGERHRLGGQLESRPRRACARGKQLHRRRVGRVGRRRFGRSERFEGYRHLAGEVKHLATRRQHSDARAFGQHRGRDTRRLRQRVLARVEEEDRLGIPQARDDTGERIGPARVDGIGDDPFDVPRATRARELDQPRAVAQVALERPPHL